MKKNSTVYECQQCGFQSAKWLGRCSDCGAWNSFVETKPSAAAATPYQDSSFYSLKSELTTLDQVSTVAPKRLQSGLSEFDRLIGGGMVPGSVILLGGDPGIGKSTIVLQLLAHLAAQGSTVAYLSGEESLDQIKLRATRLTIPPEKVYVLTENDLSQALPKIEALKPQILVVDSIQTVYQPELSSVPGSVGQVRECAGKLMFLAKSRNMIVILIGHVTKEGSLAGPKILEHMVDTVLYFEGERGQNFRILRTFKNRFGAVSELAVFEMTAEGLKEVANPSELFLSSSPELNPGSVVVSSLKGTRPILAELQALVTASALGMPRRVIVGVDSQRVALLVAVLEKVVGFRLSDQDIFLNVVGGLDVDEPSVDLGVVLAIASSARSKPLRERSLILGEVGLSGEIRPVPGVELRLEEAARLGFRHALLPKRHPVKKIPKGLEIDAVSRVEEALEWI